MKFLVLSTLSFIAVFHILMWTSRRWRLKAYMREKLRGACMKICWEGEQNLSDTQDINSVWNKSHVKHFYRSEVMKCFKYLENVVTEHHAVYIYHEQCMDGLELYIIKFLVKSIWFHWHCLLFTDGKYTYRFLPQFFFLLYSNHLL